MRLFHFSEESGIEVFEPRPVAVPSERAPGMEWLNGPLVWAIDEWHQPMYYFPRDCPRILMWPVPTTTREDRIAHWGTSSSRMIAHTEPAWLERMKQIAIYRYELPAEAFESLGDAGMWVSRESVTPVGVERIDDLPAALSGLGVELRVLETLEPLRGLWATSLHVSGIRLRNARGWNGGG